MAISFSSSKPSHSAHDLICEHIGNRGPLTFYDFMDLALYHPRYGYYHRGAPQRGRTGDYFTSLQVSTLYPEIVAEAILSMKESLGTEQFSLIEVGSGNGEFLEGVLTALSRKKQLKGFRVWAVEKSRSARDQLWRVLSRFPKCQVVATVDEIEWMGGLEGCLFSNEFFDALPFHRLRYRSSEWKEIYIDRAEGKLNESELSLSKEAAEYGHVLSPLSWEEGQEIEIRPSLIRLYQSWSQLFSRGYVLTVDYGLPRFMLYDPSRPQGTWRCFYRQQLNQQPLERIGQQDITAHIDFTQLTEAGKATGFDPFLFCSQGIFLTHVGQDRIQRWLESSNPDEKKKAVSAIQQLIHPSSMGERFWVLMQGKGAPLPEAFKNVPNRLTRLLK